MRHRGGTGNRGQRPGYIVRWQKGAKKKVQPWTWKDKDYKILHELVLVRLEPDVKKRGLLWHIRTNFQYEERWAKVLAVGERVNDDIRPGDWVWMDALLRTRNLDDDSFYVWEKYIDLVQRGEEDDA
jgi:hypothetical protein